MRSFRAKLILFNFAIVVGLTLLSVVLLLNFKRLANLPSQERSMQLRAVAYLRQMVQVTKASLPDDLKEVRRLAAGFNEDPDVVFVGVFDSDKKPLLQLGERHGYATLMKGLMGDVVPLDERRFSVWSHIERGGRRLASIGLVFSLERAQKARRQVWVFIALMAVAALLSVAATLYISRRLPRPILSITAALQRMAAGEYRQAKMPVESDDEIGDMAHAFNDMLAMLQQFGKKAVEVAKGNLSLTITAKGDLANAFRAMILSQRKLVKEIAETALQLSSTVTQFQANAEQQERGAVEQSTAVEENRRTMDSLLESARQISDTAQSVLRNAEQTQQNSRLMGERIAVLSSHTQRIAEILQVIKEIANKSDLLALNAALEGTKAGEAGRGFSLVANQMQRLAENVMDSVRNIKDLTNTITEATRATVLATEETTKLSSDTTRSARQIALIVNQQQAGTEQVTRAMEDVAHVARQTAAGGKEIVASTRDLTQLSERLRAIVDQFVLDETPES
jgi:methyl-accepting chemotaxis protein